MKPSLYVLGAATLLTVAVCARPDSHESRYRVTGSSTLAPVLQLVSEHLDGVGADFSMDVQTGGSSRGIVDARSGLADMGMSSRDLKPEEREGLDVRAIGFDGIALIVHASNPLSAITEQQVVDIYTGVLGDWSHLGGSGDITVVNKAEGRATLETFLAYFELDNQQIAADVVIGDNAQGVRLVAADPKAIGYVSIGEALSAVERGTPIKLLALDGREPTLQAVQDGSYPIRRTLYVFAQQFDARGERILDVLASDVGKGIIESLSFVPVPSSEAR